MQQTPARRPTFSIFKRSSTSYLHHDAPRVLVVDGDVKENFWVRHDFLWFFGELTRE